MFCATSGTRWTSRWNWCSWTTRTSRTTRTQWTFNSRTSSETYKINSVLSCGILDIFQARLKYLLMSWSESEFQYLRWNHRFGFNLQWTCVQWQHSHFNLYLNFYLATGIWSQAEYDPGYPWSLKTSEKKTLVGVVRWHQTKMLIFYLFLVVVLLIADQFWRKVYPSKKTKLAAKI